MASCDAPGQPNAAPQRAGSHARGGRNYELHKRAVERVIRAMSERLDIPMSNEDMASIACFSPCHFNRVFHQVTGIPPMQFLYALRLARAKQLLVTTELCITEICFEVGYNSLGTFISRFNELVGLSPNAFRRFARRVASTQLSELRPLLDGAEAAPAEARGIHGPVERPAGFDGLIFTGLFRRAIAEGQPVACALTTRARSYAVPVPPDGHWYALSAAVPWTASADKLLTLDGLVRGRSGAILVEKGRWSGDSAISFAPPHLLHPPMLATLPLLVARRFAGETPVPAIRMRRLPTASARSHAQLVNLGEEQI